MTLTRAQYDALTPAQKADQARLDVYGITVSGIFCVAKSLLAPEHLKNLTPELDRELLGMYERMLAILDRCR